MDFKELEWAMSLLKPKYMGQKISIKYNSWL